MRLLTVPLALLLAAPAAGAQDLIARPGAFPTLVNPDCSHCVDEAKRRAGELRDEDRVLCWTRGYSDGGAIPFRFFLNRYRVISDTYGVFVHDPDAGFARGFAPSLDFTFHGWRDGVMVMKHKDGTHYSCLSGRAFDGPRKGERLAPVPTLVSTWGEWVRRYPHAVAYRMFEKYQPADLPGSASAESLKSRGKPDPRLPEGTMVLGVSAGAQARAYPLDVAARDGLIADDLDGRPCVVFWYGPTRTAAAYRPVAQSPAKDPKTRELKLSRCGKVPTAPFVDDETGSRWDIAGRAISGELKGWTLEWLDGTQVKWYAWAAEYPKTTVHGVQAPAPKPKVKVNDAIKEVAGTAEFLRAVPKKFAALKGVNVAKQTVTLHCEGENEAKEWPLTADAEVKVQGWWGRLDQLKLGERVWCWFKLDRAKQPVAVFMLADALSERDIHGPKPGKSARDREPRPLPDNFEAVRAEQRAWLRQRWLSEGLPGGIGFLHVYSGEADVLLDHEALRWARSLKVGDRVELAATPPIKAVVKQVTPQREKTQVRLVAHSVDLADLVTGQRVRLKMPAPAASVDDDPLPPDVDRPRGKEERVEWFLANIYCTCGVEGDVCTGHFYTLASCNPNGCGAPNATRKLIAGKIEQGLTDRQIFEELLQQRGPLMLRPHLLP